SRYFRPRGEIVAARITAHDKHGMRSADASVARVIQRGVVHTPLMQFLHSIMCLGSKVFDFPKLNRLRWTRFSARRNQSGFLPVVAESALECSPVILIPFDHAKWTGNHAIGAPVADVGLHVHAAKLRAH